MHAWTVDLLSHLEAGRAELLVAVSDVPEAARNLCPGDEMWSVANVLSHLARTEGQIAALLQKQLRRHLAGPTGDSAPDASSSVLARFDGAPVLDRRARMAAPDFAAPDLGMTAADATARLERARDRLTQAVLAADGRDVGGVRQDHHVFGELDFYQWVLFAGFHERRHTAQLRELGATLGG